MPSATDRQARFGMKAKRPGRRTVIALVATLVVLAPIAWFWQRSLVPGDLSPMAMGYADYGGGPAAHAHHGQDVSTLKGPTGPADVTVDLVARKERFEIPGRGSMDGFTLNWHGVDVPGGEDGVAGITQGAVEPGQSFVYRFIAKHVGTY